MTNENGTKIMNRFCCLAWISCLVVHCLAAQAADPLPSAEQITFNRDIAPIVFEHCASCHRPNEVAPFSLLTYSDFKKRAPQIAQVTSRRFMPPWKSVEGHGRFVAERRLTNQQIDLIGRWI